MSKDINNENKNNYKIGVGKATSTDHDSYAFVSPSIKDNSVDMLTPPYSVPFDSGYYKGFINHPIPFSTIVSMECCVHKYHPDIDGVSGINFIIKNGKRVTWIFKSIDHRDIYFRWSEAIAIMQMDTPKTHKKG